MLNDFITIILKIIVDFGYLGIIIGMAIESSFIPFPSEIIMIPAGYLSFKGDFNLMISIICGIFGTLIGSSINYFIAKKLGRPLLLKYGKYFFISQNILMKSERFFIKHGEISTFIGRLIPGIRQIISIPAGLFQMNFMKFIILTSIGGGIWIIILTLFGYFIGHQQHLIKEYIIFIKFGAILFCLLIILIYIKIKRRK